MEIWKDIKGYEGYYQVSNLGRVRSLERLNSRGHKIKDRILKNCPNSHGYLSIILYKNGKRKGIAVHRLVAMSFLNHEPNGHEIVVDHIDNNKLNNDLNNLQLITNRENSSKDRSGNCDSTGVWLNQNGNFSCTIQLKGQKYHIGTFKSEEEASDAYSEVLEDYKNGIISVHKYKRKPSSEYKNVSWHKRSNKWLVRKRINGKDIRVGFFDSEEEAYSKAKELFGI